MNRMKKSQQQQEGGIGVLRDDVNITIWRPKDGDHEIDIIPYAVGKNNIEGDKPGSVHYTYRYFMHRNIGPANKWVICPLKTYGKPCPICEHRQRMIDKGADWDKYVKPLFPKERYLYNIVCYDRGEEKKGVQVWDVSNHYFQKHIIKLSKRPSRGGKQEKQILFFDEKDGKSIQFTVEPAQSKEDFPEYIGHCFIDRDYTISDELLDSVHCLDELVQLYSYKELKDLYNGGSTSSKDNDDDDEDEDSSINYEMLIDDLDDVEDYEELDEFIDDNELDIKIKGEKKKFKANKKKVRSWLEEKSTEQNSDDDDDDEDDLLEELEDIEDQDELDEFCEENDIDVKMKKKKFKKNLKAVKKWIEENESDDENDDDDEDDSKYDADDIEEMSKKELKAIIKKEDLDIKIKKYKDIDDLRDAVIEELGLDD